MNKTTLNDRVKSLEKDMELVKKFIGITGKLLKDAVDSVTSTPDAANISQVKLYVDANGNFKYYSDDSAKILINAGIKLTPFSVWQAQQMTVSAPTVETEGFAVGDRVKHKFGRGNHFTATIDEITDGDTAILKNCSDPYFEGVELSLSVLVKDKEWKFTDDEKIILNLLPNCYNYLVRDQDGSLLVYSDKPHKEEDCWETDGMLKRWEDLSVFMNEFKSVKWGDEEPCEFRRFI